MKNPPFATVAVAAVALSTSAFAQEGDWFQNPANGHWYTVDYSVQSVHDARALASSAGGYLASINDAAEQAWIEQTFAAYAESALWIGLSDEAQDQVFVWDSGEPFDPSFTNWGSNQPDNAQGTGTQFVRLAGPSTVSGSGTLAPWSWDDVSAPGLPATRALIECPNYPSRGWAWPKTIDVGGAPYYTGSGDFDGDGLPDVAVPSHSTAQLEVYLSTPSGDLAPIPVIFPLSQGHQAVIGDFNADGVGDVVSSGNQGIAFLSDGQGGFTTTGLGLTHGLEPGDLNLDGTVDFIVNYAFCGGWRGVRPLFTSAAGVNYGGAIWNCGDYEQFFFAVLDLDQDGDLDAVSTSPWHDRMRYFIQEPLGSWSVSSSVTDTGDNPAQLTAEDLDGDGDKDLLVAVLDHAGLGRVLVFENIGAVPGSPDLVTRADLTIGDSPRDVKAADFDGDGFMDIAVACRDSGETRIRYGVGVFDWDGGFEQVFQGHPQAIDLELADMNGDGRPDLVTTAYASATVTVHINLFSDDCDGNGVADDVDLANGAADCDGDGVLDVCQLNSGAEDCNNNGQLDTCDIASGVSLDLNANGVPDECEISSQWVQSTVQPDHWYLLLPEADALTTQALAAQIGAPLVVIEDQAENDWIFQTFGSAANALWIGWVQDDLDPSNPLAEPGTNNACAPNGGWHWADGSPCGFTRWRAGFPNNDYGANYCVMETLIGGVWMDQPPLPFGQYDILGTPRGVLEIVSGDCDGDQVPDLIQIAADLTLDYDGDGVLDSCAGGGPTYCTPNANSTGLPALLSVGDGSSPVFTDEALSLRCTDLPLNKFGYFFMGQAPLVPGVQTSADGILCVTPPLYRYGGGWGYLPLNSGAVGEVDWAIPFDNIVFPNIPFGPGETWCFQYWYRDDYIDNNGQFVNTSNMSDGLQVLFR